MKSPMKVLGLDLGTTNTAAALGGRPVELPPPSESKLILPSVVAFPPSGATLVGAPARRRRVIDAENTIYSSKRVIGRHWNSDEAREFRRRYPFKMEPTAQEQVAFVTRAGKFTPVDVASMLIRAATKGVFPEVHQKRLAVGVPASFKAPQRDATRAAAQASGFEEVVIVEEPVAAAFAYQGRINKGIAAVYDLGGGTFDFSLLDCSTQPFTVMAHDGDPLLGGDDVDQALADWAAVEVLRRHRVDLRVDLEAFDRLVMECEAAKVRLSYEDKTVIRLSQVDPVMLPADGELELDVALLTRLGADLVRRSFVLCEDVLRRVGVDRSAVTSVLMAGGSTQLPAVKAGLERFFGTPPRSDISPTQVVSIGTSLAAASILES